MRLHQRRDGWVKRKPYRDGWARLCTSTCMDDRVRLYTVHESIAGRGNVLGGMVQRDEATYLEGWFSGANYVHVLSLGKTSYA